MDTTRTTYLSLLQSGLWDKEAVINGSIDWKALMTLAQSQSTTSLICHAALQLEEDAVPATLQPKMQALLLKSINAHATANRTIARIVSRLHEESIDPVLLKGQGIASYYPTPMLRQCGDIDLYVGKEKYAAACSIIRAMYEGAPHSSEPTNKHTEFDLGGGLSLEIHQYTEVLDKEKMNTSYQAFSDAGTRNGLVPIIFNGVSVNTPEPTFNAFYIFHHLWHHTIGMGIGLRQVCDWAVFLHTYADQLDKPRLESYLRAIHLWDKWQVYGSLLVQYLGVKPEEVPFYDERKNRRSQRLLHYILTEGDNREFKFGRSEQKTKKKAATLHYIFRKTTRLLPIFPSEAMRYLIHSIHSGLKKASRPSRLVL